MRITIIYRYFAPDTPPYALMLGEMSRWFVEAGHEVEIVTSQPSYKNAIDHEKQPWREVVDGVEVRRIPLLPETGRGIVWALNGIVFATRAALGILFGRRRDLVWTATMPPVFQAAVISVAGRMRGARLVYHMMDIYPEIAITSNILKKGMLTRAMVAIDRCTIDRAGAVVVLSADMAESLHARGGRPANLAIINNFSLQTDDESGEARPPRAGGPVRFVFAGNIGRFQNLEALVDAFGAADGEEVVLEMLGDGRAKAELEARVAERGITNVRFHAHLPVESAFRFMKSCDIAVVSLLPDLYRFAYPSKVFTYLAAGLPILAIVEKASELARTLDGNGLGTALEWTATPEEIADAIAAMARRARSQARFPAPPRDLYHPASARANWLDLLARLDSGSVRAG